MKSYKENLLMIAKQILEETEATDINEIEINVDEEFGETSIVLRKHDEDDGDNWNPPTNTNQDLFAPVV